MTEDFLALTELPEKGMAVLEISRDSVEMADWDRFVKSCARLLDSKQKHLILDLRKLHRVLSVFIGEALQLGSRAESNGRRFTVLASGQVGEVFRTLLGNDLLEIVTDGRDPAQIGEKSAPGSESRWKPRPRS